MNSKLIIVLMAAALITGCVSQYKKDEANEKTAENFKVNCATAEGDIRMLQAEKVNAAKEAAAGVSTIVPVGLVVGLITGTEGEKAKIATGQYDKVLSEAISRIQSQCHVQ